MKDIRKKSGHWLNNFNSGAPVAQSQAEPHTHMGKKRKPVNEFSRGYHG